MARFKLPVIYDEASRDRSTVFAASEVGITNGVIREYNGKKLSNRAGMTESNTQSTGVVMIGIGAYDQDNTYLLVGYEISSTSIKVYKVTGGTNGVWSVIGTLCTGVTATRADVVPILSAGGLANDKDFFIKLNNPNPTTKPVAWRVSAAGVITGITDVDYPSTFTSLLANGAAYKDRYIFVLGVTSTGAGGKIAIYNSAIDDVTSWGALDYIITELNGGSSLGLELYKDHVVFFGTKNIQFFYNAGTATGSPLAPRKDLVFNYGLADPQVFGARSWWKSASGDTLAFVGQTDESKKFVAMFDGFSVRKISSPIIDALLTSYSYFTISGYAYAGKTYVHLSVGASANGASAGYYYDIEEDVWFRFQSYLPAVQNAFIADTVYNASVSDNTVFLTFATAISPSSGTGRLVRVEDRDDIHMDTDRSNVARAIYVTAVFPRWRGEPGVESRRKFLRKLNVISNTITSPNSYDNQVGATSVLGVSYSDDDYQNFSTVRNIAMTAVLKQLTQLGQFRERAFKLTYSSTQMLLLEAIEGEYAVGSN